jgi:hypothetical protein
MAQPTLSFEEGVGFFMGFKNSPGYSGFVAFYPELRYTSPN